jgi:RNA polymerase sigma-70 factor (ECF subfamily)
MGFAWRPRNTVKDDARAPELDAAVLLRCRAQDPMAFQAFVARYERMVVVLFAQMLGPGPHVEDLAQDTFIRAYEAFPRFNVDGGRPSTWLLTIAMRLAINEHKRQRTNVTQQTDAVDERTPETEQARRELGLAIQKALGDLSEDHRAVFILAELHDLTLAEIANALAIPENTAKTRLFRAREQLRKLLEPMRKGGEDADR